MASGNLLFNLPHYMYKPLPPRCIRVLELDPGSSNTPLSCSLVAQDINGEPYDALSYVWGVPTPVTLIKCSDAFTEGELGIGEGLTKALTAFRHPDRMRRIWVDAVCINQKDMAERQSQVRLMGAVYEEAKHVLCWLGPFDDGNDEETNQGQGQNTESKARLAINLLRIFNDNPTEHLKAIRDHLHPKDGEEVTDSERLSLHTSWLAIKELFDLEYFHRAWIIQEVGLARHARLFWGSQDVWLEWREVATFCRYMDDNGASVINELGMKSWVANHINLVWENDASGKPIHNFVEVLHWARVHRSTDPRDYVYALLSHPSATVDGSLLVQPNYSITSAQAYMHLALNVIKRMNSLLILAFVDHHEEPGVLNLPTWVPDWHALNLVAPLRCPTQAAPETDFHISFVDTKKGMVLNCRGFLIDKIVAMTDMIEPSELIITTLEKETRKKIPFLVDHIWRRLVLEPSIPVGPLGEFLASLSLVLSGGFWDAFHSTSGKYLEPQKSDLAAFILEYERIRVDEQTDSLLTSLSTKERAWLEKTAGAGGSAHQFVQDMTWMSMCRKVFRTAKGSIGLGPRIMRNSDICAVLLGAVYPMILRKTGDSFELVGPAVVYGLMNGEACRDGKFVEQGFQIC